uniref:Myb-like domain-containing protein n=1 Tax=Ditylenchus dipsaci TaxID=166011 RepID=A0A915E2D3_9BILA
MSLKGKRNYQYTPEEEAQMDAFGETWKQTNRGVKGPTAWREFKRSHTWARFITADDCVKKYTRLKRDQSGEPMPSCTLTVLCGHATCVASITTTNAEATDSPRNLLKVSILMSKCTTACKLCV